MVMKTLSERSVGETTVRLLDNGEGFTAAVLGKGGLIERFDGDEPEEVLSLAMARALQTAGAYVGYDGAITRFREHFPEGFEDPEYARMERDYKLAAASRLERGATLEDCLEAGREQCDIALGVFGTNMLSTFENARARECLKGEEGPLFLQGAARFANGEIEAGIAGMRQALSPYGKVSWPLVTFLPFLWRPQTNMFLKPEATTAFAARVGDPFGQHYESAPNPETWAALDRLAEETLRRIAVLKPKDRIDVQSFIWVVGNY